MRLTNYRVKIAPLRKGAFLSKGDTLIISGHFYFLSQQFFTDFPDPNILPNKQVNCSNGGRPYFAAFEKDHIWWMIPITSKRTKFENLYKQKIQKYGKCDTIVLADCFGTLGALLIQNMVPVVEAYIKCEYCNSQTNLPYRVSQATESTTINNSQKIYALVKTNPQSHLVFTNILSIETALKNR